MRVKFRKEEADKLASIYTVTWEQHIPNIHNNDLEYKSSEEFYLLKMYLKKLLLVHKGQLLIAQADWDAGLTLQMIQGCTKMIDFYEAVLLELSTFYPKGSFGEKHPKMFFSEQVALRTSFHVAIAEPYGPESIGSIGRASISFRIMEDLKLMVKDMAWQLIETSPDLDFTEFENWCQEWLGDKAK